MQRWRGEPGHRRKKPQAPRFGEHCREDPLDDVCLTK
jgi:hypothetical protein